MQVQNAVTRWTSVRVDPVIVPVAKNNNPNCVASCLPYNIQIALTHHSLHTTFFIHRRVIIVIFFPPSKCWTRFLLLLDGDLLSWSTEGVSSVNSPLARVQAGAR